MNNGIFVQNLIDKQSSDIGLPRNSLFNNRIIPLPYGYGGDEYWKYDPNKFVLLYDTRYSNNTNITLPLGSGPGFNLTIDWGDGAIIRYVGAGSNINYTYSSHGIYLVQISGSMTAWGANFINTNANKLIKCLSFGSFPLTALYYAFDRCSNLIEIPNSLPSTVTQLQYCFRDCSSLKQNLVNVYINPNTPCTEMLRSCSLKDANLSGWVFGGNNSASSMFFGCRDFVGNGLETWDTSGIVNMAAMLSLCGVNVDISSWNTSNVTAMNSMFSDNVFFNQPIGSWDTSKVTVMNSMFRNASSFDQDIGAWNVSAVTNFSDMFFGRIFNNGGSSSINNWNTSSATNMSTMFQNCSMFNQPLNNWNVRKVTNFTSMFQSATSFNSSLSGWALGADTVGTTCANMFLGATNFNQDISNWDTSKVTNMSSMFAHSSANTFNQNIGDWNVSNVTNFATMFWSNSTNLPFNHNLGAWNVSKGTTFGEMFRGCISVSNQDLRNWNLARINTAGGLDNFMLGKTGANAMTTANYDALLIGWNNNKLVGANGVANWRTDLRPNFGGAKYTAGGAAAAARAALVSYGWTITDGGVA